MCDNSHDKEQAAVTVQLVENLLNVCVEYRKHPCQTGQYRDKAKRGDGPEVSFLAPVEPFGGDVPLAP